MTTQPGMFSDDQNKSSSLMSLQKLVPLLLNNTEEAFVLFDAQLQIQIFNSKAQQIYLEYLGLTIKTGAIILDFVQPDRKEIIFEKCSQALGGTILQWESRLIFTDGRLKDFAFKFNPAKDENNNIIGVFATAKDITEQKQLAQQALSTEKRFKALVENSGDAISIIDDQGKHLYTSPGFQYILGYSYADAAQLSLYTIMHPDDLLYAGAKIAESLKTPGVPIHEVVYRLKHQNQEWICVSATITCCLHDPLIGGIITNFRDITQDRKNLSALEATITDFNKIMDSSLDMICEVDQHGFFVRVSPACKAILGYTPDEMIGHSVQDFIHPEDLLNTLKIADSIMAGQSLTNFENRYIAKNGAVVPLQWTASWNPTDKMRYSIARDATQIKKNKAALVESERKYKYLFENNPLPIIIWDFSTLQILDVNEEAVVKYGYTRDEFLKLTIKDIRPAEDIPLIEAATETEDTYGYVHRQIWRHQKKNGEIMFMEITGHLINYNGKKASLALSNDVTESRYYLELDKLERSLLEMNAENDKTLSEVMDTYLRGMEKLHQGMLCSIQEVRGNKLYNLASPSLPEEYLKAIEGVEIGNNVGSCGTAAFLKQKVIVADIAYDIRWKNYKEIALRNGLKACWSSPILDSTGNVMATFACYYQEHKTPAQLEEKTINRAGHILQVILESFQRARAIRVSNERFEYVTDATSAIIWDWNLETNTVYYSKNMLKLFGHDFNKVTDGKQYYLEQVHPEDRDKIILYTDLQKLEPILNWTQEYRFKKTNGEYAFVLDKGIVIRNKTGLGVRMVGALQDITRQKQEEHHLKLLESVITHTTDAVLICDAVLLDEPGPRIVFVNEAFTKMTGYTANEIVGKTPRILQGPKSDKKELKRLGECLRKYQSCEITTINYKKNGEEFWINFSVSPVADEKGIFTHFIAVERDITAQKNEELQIGLLAEISLLFNTPSGVNDTLIKVLERIAHFGDFSVAEAWLIGPEKKKLSLAAKFSLDKPPVVSDGTAQNNYLLKTENMPTAGWNTEGTRYWHHLQKKQGFIYPEAAATANLKAAYGIPLQHNSEVIGVLVIGLSHAEKMEAPFITFFENFNSHFGSEIKRKQLEQELSQIFNFAADVICTSGRDGYFKKVNPAMCNLLGYTEQELLNNPIAHFIHPDDLEISRAARLHFTKTTQPFYVENRYITKSGKIKWLAWTTNPSPEAGFLFAVAKDITDKKELEDLLNKATNMARIGSWEIDLIGGSIYWSPMTREIHEVDEDFILKPESTSAFYKEGEDRDLIVGKITETVEKGLSFDIEVRITTAKGNIKWIRVIGEGEFANNQCIRVYGSFQDIDAHKRATNSLLESEKRYSELFHLSPLPMFVCDYETSKFLDVNIAAINHYGYSTEEFLQMSLSDIELPLYTQKTEYLDFTAENKSGGNMQGVFNHKKKNGEIIQVEVQSNVILFKGSKARVALANDITDRLSYISAIEQQNKKLIEISWLQSHVVRAPLARIMGLIPLIEDANGNTSDKQLMMKYLLASANELDDVIRNITDKTNTVDF